MNRQTNAEPEFVGFLLSPQMDELEDEVRRWGYWGTAIGAAFDFDRSEGWHTMSQENEFFCRMWAMFRCCLLKIRSGPTQAAFWGTKDTGFEYVLRVESLGQSVKEQREGLREAVCEAWQIMCSHEEVPGRYRKAA